MHLHMLLQHAGSSDTIITHQKCFMQTFYIKNLIMFYTNKPSQLTRTLCLLITIFTTEKSSSRINSDVEFAMMFCSQQTMCAYHNTHRHAKANIPSSAFDFSPSDCLMSSMLHWYSRVKERERPDMYLVCVCV